MQLHRETINGDAQAVQAVLDTGKVHVDCCDQVGKEGNGNNKARGESVNAVLGQRPATNCLARSSHLCL
jgi:hypothetical protein